MVSKHNYHPHPAALLICTSVEHLSPFPLTLLRHALDFDELSLSRDITKTLQTGRKCIRVKLLQSKKLIQKMGFWIVSVVPPAG